MQDIFTSRVSRLSDRGSHRRAVQQGFAQRRKNLVFYLFYSTHDKSVFLRLRGVRLGGDRFLPPRFFEQESATKRTCVLPSARRLTYTVARLYTFCNHVSGESENFS